MRILGSPGAAHRDSCRASDGQELHLRCTEERQFRFQLPWKESEPAVYGTPLFVGRAGAKAENLYMNGDGAKARRVTSRTRGNENTRDSEVWTISARVEGTA